MSSGDPEIDRIREQLQAAFPPWRDLELRTDLWPRMRHRLEEAPPPFGWFEALLAAAIVVVLAVFPDLIPVLFYHL